MSYPLGEAVHVAPSGHYHSLDDDPIFEKDLFWYCIRLVVVISSLKLHFWEVEDSWGLFRRWFPSYFPQHLHFCPGKTATGTAGAQTSEAQPLYSRAPGTGPRPQGFHPSYLDALDPMVQALQKFQSTSMTSSSPLALGGFFVKRFFWGASFFFGI